VDTVFFDLVGTLIQARRSIGTQYAEIAGHFGIEADAPALDRVFRAVLGRSPTFALPNPAEADVVGSEKRTWRAIVETVFLEAGCGMALRSASFDEYFEALFDHFATRDAWILYPDVIPSLGALRRGGRRIGLISNFDSRVFPLLDSLGLAPAFASVTIPGLAGAAKPDPAIFRHALAAHAIAPAEAVYVGDSVAEDILPARAAGMAAVLIDREAGSTQLGGVISIESLNGLEELVAGMSGARSRT
jgi:putative hydrolase of the HAD superfamily